MTPDLIAYAVAALLAVAAVLDMKNARIPNWLVLAIVALFPLQWLMFPETVTPVSQLIFAVVVFVLGFGLFMTGGFGAGAVKLMAATALFLPADQPLWMLGLFFACVIGALILFGLARMFAGSETSGWAVLRKRVIPMAAPIAATGWIGMFLF